MKKYILAVWDKNLPKISLPRNWEIQKTASFAEGMKKFKELAPSIIMMPESHAGQTGIGFLKDIKKNAGVIPPSILWGFNAAGFPTEEEMDLLGILAVMEGEPKFKEIALALQPFFAEPPLPPMTIPEFLAAVISEERSGIYQFKMGNTGFKIVLKDGQLQGGIDEVFRKSYRDYLSQGGVDLPRIEDDIAADIVKIDSIPSLDRKKMSDVKAMAFNAFFGGLPLDQNTSFLKESPKILTGSFITADVFSVLRTCVDKISFAHLEPLKNCSFKRNEDALKKSKDFFLSPDEGYIFHSPEKSNKMKITVTSLFGGLAIFVFIFYLQAIFP